MAWYRGKSGGGGTVTPTDGIYASAVKAYKGYYNQGYQIEGWETSTELLFHVNGGAPTLYNVTACSLDGTPLTITSNYASFPNSGVDYTIDHVLEFTVKEGTVPYIQGSNNSARTVSKCIFNK